MAEGGGSVTYDSSGNQKVGTIDSLITWSSGAYGHYLDWASVINNLDFINLGPASRILPTAIQATIVVRARFIDLTSDQRLVTFRLGSTSKFAVLVGRTDNKVSAFARNAANGLINIDSTANVTVNTWYDVAFVADPPNGILYIDGMVQGSNATVDAVNTFNFTTDDVEVGGVTGGTAPFTGAMSFLRIYNRALTPSEVMSLYADPFLEFKRRRRYFFVQQEGINLVPRLMAQKYAMRRRAA